MKGRVTWRRERDENVVSCTLGYSRVALTGCARMAPTGFDVTGQDSWKEKILVTTEQAEDHFTRGNVYLDMGEYELALRHFDEAIRLNPQDSSCYIFRGSAYGELGQHDRALLDYDLAVRLEPKDAFAYAKRGVAYRKLDQQEKAIQDYDEAIRLEPHNDLYYLSRGLAYRELGQYERAILDHDVAINLEPHMAFYYSSRGHAYLQLGQHERALLDYNEAIGLEPNDAYHYSSRGDAYLQLGQHESALLDYDEAIRLEPRDPYYYSSRAIIYEELGQSERSRSDSQMARTLEAALVMQDDDEDIELDSFAEVHVATVREDQTLNDLSNIVEDIVTSIQAFSFAVEDKQKRGVFSLIIGSGLGGPAAELSRRLEDIHNQVTALGIRANDPSVKDQCSILIDVLSSLISSCEYIRAYNDIPAFQPNVTDAMVGIVDVGKQLAIQIS